MRAVAKRIEEVAASRSPVLIEAEPGCEQDVVARAIHVGSAREDRPFVRVTCAAFRGEALERELFGWRKGAFPGALDDRAGRFELADGGTLFLDAPDTPSASLQARLLRILDEGIAERVGSTEPHRLDVRLVISLPHGLDRAWSRAGVLPELLSKLEVFPIQLAPLRERQDDIVPLAEHFLRKYGRRNARAATAVSDDAKSVLSKYDFPGNARELENVIERAAILAHGDVIEPAHLAFQTRPQLWDRPSSAGGGVAPTSQAGSSPQPTSEAQGDLTTRLEDIERRELLAALERCGGNKAEVARTLGIQRTTLYYRLKRLGIEA